MRLMENLKLQMWLASYLFDDAILDLFSEIQYTEDFFKETHGFESHLPVLIAL